VAEFRTPVFKPFSAFSKYRKTETVKLSVYYGKFKNTMTFQNHLKWPFPA